MLNADAVFEGGGVKGIGLVGAVCCLEEHGYKWQRLAGTSAGSIIASLLAVGYTGKEMKEILFNLNYKNFIQKSGFTAVPLLGTTIDFIISKGKYSSDAIQTWVKELLKAKGKTKFKDISMNGESSLKIIATDITNNDVVILPDDIKKYGLDPMELEISEAVRMSISIPFYFQPVKIEYHNRTYFIIDGGVLSNFPVWIFDTSGIPRWPTFGFKIVEPETARTLKGKEDFISYTLDIIHTFLDANEMRFPVNKDFVRTICVPSMGVKTTDFSISVQQSEELFDSGYQSAKKFIDSWNFQQYVQKHRSNPPNPK